MPQPQNNIVSGLWNEHIHAENYGDINQYKSDIFTQYKIFVDAADKISMRRSITNTFFLTLHTLLMTALGFIYEKGPVTQNIWVNVFPLFALLTMCYVWYRMLQSYRQLNAAKYKIIGEFEQQLPASPFWNAEWKALGSGNNSALYKPLTDLEKIIPILFAIIYILGFLAIIFI